MKVVVDKLSHCIMNVKICFFQLIRGLRLANESVNVALKTGLGFMNNISIIDSSTGIMAVPQRLLMFHVRWTSQLLQSNNFLTSMSHH